MEGIVIIGMLIASCALTLSSKKAEREKWNNGYSTECNTKWRQTGIDSQNGREYVCKCSKRHRCWINYDVDRY